MSKGDNRLKILYVLDELRANSKNKSENDEKRFLSANTLIEILQNKYNLTADRKSVYNYIESLSKYGYDIEKTRRGYYFREHYEGYDADHPFEMAELKLIVDALSASRFISAKKTQDIISKLKRLSDDGDVSLENRRVYLERAIKSDNFSVIYNIDAIHRAVMENHKISFTYRRTVVDFDQPSKKLVDVNKTDENGDDKLYIQSPFALVWKNEFYYVICYDSESRCQKTFRVDRMKDVIVDESSFRDGIRFFEDVDITEYANTAFSMFSGDRTNVVLRVRKDLAGVIADRFGRDISIYHCEEDESSFKCSVFVQKSDQFYSWLCGFGSGVELMFPPDMRSEFRDYLKNVIDQYNS